ncbi:MAG: hypothetical protein A3C53_05335 [Omnitrophica WOR_2 bacterium RIFCSPHIGHO2_02_FULL_68_15]|nr:MAG: hypothetical protein A3C53_05335 [Omnitrophica WOR_2 bacterium RIFCSPHIGHO2_02_FULL_68_15]
MTVMSLRLSDRELRLIQQLSRAESKERSQMVRELLEEGRVFHLLRLYREGALSLGRLAAQLSKSLGETLDLLSEFGQTAPVDYGDYLQGRKTAGRLFAA